MEKKTVEINQKEQEIKNTIKQFSKKIESHIWETNLSLVKPPYFQTYFSQWRRQSLKALQNYIKDLSFEDQQLYLQYFSYEVDQKLLNDFILKIKTPYFDKVLFEGYGVPGTVNLQSLQKQNENISQEMQRLTYQITEWCIQLEVSADTIDRSEALGLYIGDQKKDLKIYTDLKQQLAGERQQTYGEMFAKYFRKGLSYGLKQVSGFVWSQGMSSTNLTYGSLLLLYYTFLGSGSLPLQIIFPKSKLLYLAGGVISSYAIGSIAQQIDDSELVIELQELTKGFKDIVINLKEFNLNCRNLIDKCIRAKDIKLLEAEKLVLNAAIKELLQHTDKFKQQREEILKINEYVEKELEDDWVMLEKKQSTDKKSEDQIYNQSLQQQQQEINHSEISQNIELQNQK